MRKPTQRSAQEIKTSWETDARWKGVLRTFTAEEVTKIRGSFQVDYTLAKYGANKLWEMVNTPDQVPVTGLGAMTGNQALQQVAAGLRAIYLSGWQVAADANTAGEMYPDQSLYPVDAVPNVVRKINQAFQRADQISHAENPSSEFDWFVPIIADAEAGFGGNLNTYELVKHLIEAGAAGIHLEDQVASQKKCGHLGGKVLVPTQEFVDKLIAARLASDAMDVPTIIIARTDANAATLLTNDVDERDKAFMTGERTREGFYVVRSGIDQAIARAIAYAPYADMLWCETSTPDIEEARAFAAAVHAKYPGKLLAYNCSPSFNWSAKLDAPTIATFRQQLASMGYVFQFITLAGFHSLNFSMYDLAYHYAKEGMTAYSRLQDQEFKAAREIGYTAVKHQRFVGTGYFDNVNTIITSGSCATLALAGSTEEEQFNNGHH